MANPLERLFSPSEPIDPHLRRWTLFVDGENVTIRGQVAAKARGIILAPGRYYQQDVFLWLPRRIHATRGITTNLRGLSIRAAAERAFYYTSVSGDSNALMHVQEALWDLGFKPEVFKKQRKESKGKGVDIALTKDVLSNAFLNNYDVAVIMTGDADYRPVIDELKRLGKTVCIMAFTEGAKVNRELKLSADFFMPLDDLLLRVWSTDRIMADLQ